MIFRLHISLIPFANWLARPLPKSNSPLWLEYTGSLFYSRVTAVVHMEQSPVQLEWCNRSGHVRLLSDERGESEKNCLMWTITLHIPKCPLQRHFSAITTRTTRIIKLSLLVKLNSGINYTIIYPFLTLLLKQLPKSWTALLLLYSLLCFCVILRLLWYRWTSSAETWSVLIPGHHSPTGHILCIALWFLLTPCP